MDASMPDGHGQELALMDSLWRRKPARMFVLGGSPLCTMGEWAGQSGGCSKGQLLYACLCWILPDRRNV